MNHFVFNLRSARRAALGAVVAMGAIVFVHPTIAQPAPAATTPATKAVIKRAGPAPGIQIRQKQPLAPAEATMVANWVSTEAAAMVGGDPQVMASARAALISAAAIPVFNNPGRPPTPASPDYQAKYSTALEAALLKQFGGAKLNPDARQRLNAAVTLAKVAEVMNQGSTLATVTEKAIDDPSEAVAMWGVRAARFVYPNLIQLDKKRADTIAAKAIAAMRKFPKSAPIAEDTFETIAGKAITGDNLKAKAGFDAMVKLLQARAHMYMQATPAVLPEADPFFPSRPELDAPVMTFLAITGWKDMTPAQKAAAGRAILDQANELVRVGTVLPPRAPGDTMPRVEDMMKELRNAAGALQVICGKPGANGQPLAPAGAAAAINAGKLANNQPAAPLIQAELSAVGAAMTAGGVLGPVVPDAGAGGPAAANAPAVNPAPAANVPAAKPASPSSSLNK